ncbi:DUF998 domain-containing protein [Streptomyces sp. NPDC087212]|uniref:DUF998 domain-containing protein n=1 Tax=Streptomyces sp. NPDC087212 TaxID=3365766 RepID=UPI0037F9EDBC
MTRRSRLRLGALVLVVNAVQWVVAEAITAAAWTDPPYSYVRNYISDLGVSDCGTQFQGRVLCSPDHTLMNVSFIAEGVLFALGIVLLARLVEGRVRRVVIALALAHAVGLVLVGLFHGSANGPQAGLALHVGGAAVGIICANTLVIMAGSLRGLGASKAYRVFSVTVGVLGLVSEALTGVSASTAGAFERGGVYSWLLWSTVTGVLLLVRDRRATRRDVLENVSA